MRATIARLIGVHLPSDFQVSNSCLTCPTSTASNFSSFLLDSHKWKAVVYSVHPSHGRETFLPPRACLLGAETSIIVVYTGLVLTALAFTRGTMSSFRSFSIKQVVSGTRSRPCSLPHPVQADSSNMTSKSSMTQHPKLFSA